MGIDVRGRNRCKKRRTPGKTHQRVTNRGVSLDRSRAIAQIGGKSRNNPVVRNGALSAIPHEKVLHPVGRSRETGRRTRSWRWAMHKRRRNTANYTPVKLRVSLLLLLAVDARGWFFVSEVGNHLSLCVPLFLSLARRQAAAPVDAAASFSFSRCVSEFAKWNFPRESGRRPRRNLRAALESKSRRRAFSIVPFFFWARAITPRNAREMCARLRPDLQIKLLAAS